MADIKYVDENGLLYLWSKITGNFVAQEEGKGLSTNDLTDALVEKINNAGDSSFTGNYSDLTGAPTNLSDFTNDVGYQTADDVTSLIQTAVANLTSISYSIVEELPETGETGVIYLISNSGSGNNIYDEYIWTGSAMELLGTTELSLDGYVQESDLTAITNSEIDTLLA